MNSEPVIIPPPRVIEGTSADMDILCDVCGRAWDQVVEFAFADLCFDCAQTRGKEMQKLGKRLEGKIRRQQEKQAKEK